MKHPIPGLDALRFIAASMVLVCHLEQNRYLNQFPSYWFGSFHTAGGQGVRLFFVLSGFLITFLLLKERELTGKISVRSFYIRRILRIWPLYYLVFLLAFLVAPNFYETFSAFQESSRVLSESFWESFLLYLVFLPNLALDHYGAIFMAAPLWSLGIEEQFYLIWPWFTRWTSRYFPWLLLQLLGIHYWVMPLLIRITDENPILKYFHHLELDLMVWGALGGWLYFQHLPLVKKIFHFWGAGLLASGLLAYSFFHVWGNWAGAGFLCVILAATKGRLGPFNLSYPLFRFLGRISFGIYVWHAPCVFLANRVGAQWGALFTYPFAFVVTIAVASLSYSLIEAPFLRKQARFRTNPSWLCSKSTRCEEVG